MVAPDGVRKAWWVSRSIGLAVLAVVLLAVAATTDSGQTKTVCLVVAGLCLAAVVLNGVLWRRGKL